MVFPLFLSEIGTESVVPSVTVPNATLDGLAAICAWSGALTLSASVAEPVPPLFVALKLTLKVPELAGVPEIRPVVELTARPEGRLEAP